MVMKAVILNDRVLQINILVNKFSLIGGQAKIKNEKLVPFFPFRFFVFLVISKNTYINTLAALNIYVR